MISHDEYSLYKTFNSINKEFINAKLLVPNSKFSKLVVDLKNSNESLELKLDKWLKEFNGNIIRKLKE